MAPLRATLLLALYYGVVAAAGQTFNTHHQFAAGTFPKIMSWLYARDAFVVHGHRTTRTAQNSLR